MPSSRVSFRQFVNHVADTVAAFEARLPRAFDGYALLHITDMHVDMNAHITRQSRQRTHGA